MDFHRKRTTGAFLTLTTIGILAFHHIGHTQTTSGQSDYIFRFNTGISSVFLANMTFPQQQPIDLGSCTATEKINGPLACAVNCSNQSVCLLDLTGPSGSTVNDVLELVSETPSTSATGTASPNPTVSALPSVLPGGSILFGNMAFRSAIDKASNTPRRIEAYKTAK